MGRPNSLGCRSWQLCEGTPSSARPFRVDRPSISRGRRTRTALLLTEADLSFIDDDIDVYLAAAEIPPRPRGYDWYIRRPIHYDLDDEMFWGFVWAATTERLPHDGLRPTTMAGPVKETMASFCRD